MGYKHGRVTISSKQSICNKCLQIINKGESIYVEPGKLVIHKRCKDVKS